MLRRILPPSFDNRFGGYRAGIWLFGLYVLVRLAMSFNTIVNTRTVAAGADGVPLDSFGAAAASRFLSLFAALGISQLSLALLGGLAIARYRAMIPLLYVLLLGEMLARRLVIAASPLARTGTRPPGFYINLALLALLAAGLLLSVLENPSLKDREA